MPRSRLGFSQSLIHSEYQRYLESTVCWDHEKQAEHRDFSRGLKLVMKSQELVTVMHFQWEERGRNEQQQPMEQASSVWRAMTHGRSLQ